MLKKMKDATLNVAEDIFPEECSLIFETRH